MMRYFQQGILPDALCNEMFHPSFDVAEGRASVAPALEKLPDRERRILYLRFFQGMTQTEAARVLGVAAVTVKRRLNRGLRLLTEKLADLQPD